MYHFQGCHSHELKNEIKWNAIIQKRYTTVYFFMCSALSGYSSRPAGKKQTKANLNSPNASVMSWNCVKTSFVNKFGNHMHSSFKRVGTWIHCRLWVGWNEQIHFVAMAWPCNKLKLCCVNWPCRCKNKGANSITSHKFCHSVLLAMNAYCYKCVASVLCTILLLS